MRLSLVALALALAACQTAPSPAPFSEHVIATIPDDVEVEGLVSFSRDGRQAAYIARTSDGCRAVRGTWKSMLLDSL